MINTRRYYYDANHQLCRTAEPESYSTVLSYDPAGNLAWSAAGLNYSLATACYQTQAQASGRRVDRTYDVRNRIKTLSFPDGLGDQTLTYAVDGLLESVVTDNGGANIVTNTYGYNKRRLLTSERLQWGSVDWSLGYSYNTNGHLTSQSQPLAPAVSFAPNALGQPTQVGAFATAASYYPNGALKQFTYGNGIVHTMTQNTRQLPDTSCDAYGTCSAGAPLYDGYDYDENGNVAAISDGTTGARGNRTMTYDGLDRLKTAVSPMYGNATYAYDVLDNLTRTTIGGTAARDHYYCYDTRWQLTNIKTGSCSGTSVIGLGYDVQGNLNNQNGQAYVFDYGNRLRGVTGVASYVYDGHGLRVRDYTTASKYSFYSRAGQLVYTQDLRQAKQSNYFYLGGSLVAIREEPNGQAAVALYQHTDALGSPVAVTNAARTIVEKSEYEPYGGLLNRPLEDGPGYTSHVSDAATGLSYMQQRYYDPMVGGGRFLSVDPVTTTAVGGNFNRYSYANSNPYRYYDPNGMFAEEAESGGCQGTDCTEDQTSEEEEDEAEEAALQRARELLTALLERSKANPNQPLRITRAELNTLLKLTQWQVGMVQASSGSFKDMRPVSFLVLMQDSSGDSWFQGFGRSGVKFTVEAGLGAWSGTHNAADMNYVFQGMAWAAKGESRLLMNGAIAGWNIWQATQRGSTYDLKQIGPAMHWADLGYSYYEQAGD